MPQIQLLKPGPISDSVDTQNTRPHVLLVVDGFPKALGGGERIVLRIAALLPRYGYRASILTFAMHPESSFRVADAPCPVYLLPLRNTYGPSAWRGAAALRRLLRDQKVKIVQTFFESSDLWAGAVTRLLSPAKLIWSRRDMGILRGAKHRSAYRLLRRLPHAVFAVSAKVAEHVITVDGVSPDRVHIIHNGLDLATAVTTEAVACSAAPVVATIGNIRFVKGHDLLVQAAALVAATVPDILFTVAGEVLEPEFFAALQDQVAVLGLAPNFRFLGKVDDLATYLASAKIFVLPSRSEGFSNALIEAMSMGLACIATDVGGNAEAIQDGVSGLVVPAEDASALAQAILQLVKDPAFGQRLSIGAKEAVTRQFSAEGMMLKMAAAYKQVS